MTDEVHPEQDTGTLAMATLAQFVGHHAYGEVKCVDITEKLLQEYYRLWLIPGLFPGFPHHAFSSSSLDFFPVIGQFGALL